MGLRKIETCSSECPALRVAKIARALHQATCVAGPDGTKHIAELGQVTGTTQVETSVLSRLECWYPAEKAKLFAAAKPKASKGV